MCEISQEPYLNFFLSPESLCKTTGLYPVTANTVTLGDRGHAVVKLRRCNWTWIYQVPIGRYLGTACLQLFRPTYLPIPTDLMSKIRLGHEFTA